MEKRVILDLHTRLLATKVLLQFSSTFVVMIAASLGQSSALQVGKQALEQVGFQSTWKV